MLDTGFVRDIDGRGFPGIQYGDVFTFILFGRKVTVALGTQGNNFVLGGKVAHFSAEDAYKVRQVPSTFFRLPRSCRLPEKSSRVQFVGNLTIRYSRLSHFVSPIGCHGPGFR